MEESKFTHPQHFSLPWTVGPEKIRILYVFLLILIARPERPQRKNVKLLDFHGFAGHLTPPSRKAKINNCNFKSSAGAAVGAAGTKAGGRTAKLDDHIRNRGRVTAAGIKVHVQNFPTRCEIHENEQETLKMMIF